MNTQILKSWRAMANAAVISLAATISAQGTFLSIGSGCTGVNGRPLLSVTGDLKVGGRGTIRVSPLPKETIGVLVFGVRQISPLNLQFLGFPKGCYGHTSMDLIFGVTSDDFGVYSLSGSLPNLDSYIGTRTYLQYATDDGRSPIVSNAGRVIIGCGNSPSVPAVFTLKSTLPRITALNFPGMSVSTPMRGSKWKQCCSQFGSRECVIIATGTASGNVGTFTLPISSITSTVNNTVCSAIKKITAGAGSCSTSLNARLGSVRLSGTMRVDSNGCTHKTSYSGGGALAFGPVSGTARTTFKIKIIFKSYEFGFDIGISGTPTGSWSISSNRLLMTIKISSLRFRASYKLPLPSPFNKTLSLDFSVPTPFLTGTSQVPLPTTLPVGC